jgi:sigma-B regulation protein RsbU (phosphoserine phosphatase)
MILPVGVLLIAMGAAGFFYARGLLFTQWREASILKLQRAAHEADMRLGQIKDSIRMFHESPETQDFELFQSWALEHLARQEGVADVRLRWDNAAEGGDTGRPPPDAVGRTSRGMPGMAMMGRWFQMRRFHSARITKITPPRFDTGSGHGTVSLISDLSDENGRAMGQLDVVVDFAFIFRHVVESGWWQSSKAFLVDNSGQILICTETERHGRLADRGDPLELATLSALSSGPSGTLLGPGHPPEEVSGYQRLHEAPWSLVMIAPGRDILAPILELRLIFFLAGIGFIAVIIALIRRVTLRTTAAVRRVSDAAIRLSQGEFGEPLTVASRDEVGELTRSFNTMTALLKEGLQMKTAMGLAMEVQQNLLPSAPPEVPGLDLAGRSIYCQETGGDYYDYISPPDGSGAGHLFVAVGDVVGHGISAALLMTTARALLRCRLHQPGSISEVVRDVNRLLIADTAESGSFVTLFLLRVGPENGPLEWVRAGHDPALIYRRGEDRLSELEGPGMALGVDDAEPVHRQSLPGLEEGDIVLIGTDGIWETENRSAEKFGKQRVADCLRGNRGRTAAEIMESVLSALEEFRGDAPQEDDVTLVVVKARK